MLKWLPLLPGLLSFFAITTFAQTLKIGYFDLPPHTFPDDKARASTAIHFFDKVAGEMGVQVEYRHLPLQRLLFMVKHEQLDAALFLASNPERNSLFIFPATPLFQAQSVYVVRADSVFQTAGDINKESALKIGVWQGGYQSNTLLNSKNRLIPLSGNNVAARALELVFNRRFDAFYSPDKYAVEFAARQNNMQDCIRIIPINKEIIPLFTVFNKKSAALYLKKFEQAQKKVKAKHNYDALLEQQLQGN